LSEYASEVAALSSRKFNSILSALTHRAILADMPNVMPQPVGASESDDTRVDPGIDWSFALLCCSALTGSKDRLAQEAALRVAQSCISAEDTSEDLKMVATVLLERLGNRPAIRLAIDRELVREDSWTSAPPRLLLDVIYRRLELMISPITGTSIAASDFQREFWDGAGTSKWLSVSAPTSAGKSFIVKRWFEEAAGEDAFRGIYLVPTRALIEEVSLELSKAFGASIKVHTIPWAADIGLSNREVFVLTQERLHLLQQRDPTFTAQLLFIDEAQKFGDRARGILLQQVLDEAVRRNPNTQVIFASPLTDNPELLLKGAPSGARILSISNESVTVNQNLLWAKQITRKPKSWELTVLAAGEEHQVGFFDLMARPSPASKRLPLVAVALGSRGGNVVYVNGAAEAEKTALQIYETLGAISNIDDNDDITSLQELVRVAVHPQYSLADVLARGVAYHYGNMPLLIKSEIEQLFRKGVINYLVCTSTLLEGVNLPCHNIFIRGPRKGRGNVMTSADFWNLAGRAGRWGMDFQGNIICVDADDLRVWPNPPRNRARRPLHRSIDGALSDLAPLKALINSGAPEPGIDRDPVLESVFSLLAARVAEGLPLTEMVGIGAEPEKLAELQTLVQGILSDIELPSHTLARHAGVNPFAMQQLLQIFRQSRDPQDFLLPPPEDLQAAQSYSAALALSSEYLGASFGSNRGRHMQLAILITKWMRGFPLARLIDERVSYQRNLPGGESTANVIRSVLDDIEQVARFEAPKYLACYVDILNLHLMEIGSDVLNQNIDLPMMLELGVSRTTEVSLMALGLSRTTVVALSEFIVDDEFTPEDCIAWLGRTNIEGLGLPRLILKELNQVLDEFQS